MTNYIKCPVCGNHDLSTIAKSDNGYLCDCGALFFVDSKVSQIEVENLEKLPAIGIRLKGLDYKNGSGGKVKDIKKAIECFELAARRGDNIAQYHLAMCYDKGDGVTIDKEKALLWLKKSASDGCKQALCELEEKHPDEYKTVLKVLKDKNELFERLFYEKLPYCMSVCCYQKNSAKGGKTGSAFLLKSGLILTNAHVVMHENEKSVYDYEYNDIRAYFAKEIDIKRVSHELTIVHKDITQDIAILKFATALPSHLKIGEGFDLGESEKARRHEKVFSIGNPKNYGLGRVSGEIFQESGTNQYFGRYDEVLQLNMNINSGNSGAPLIDAHGQVIGITTFTPKNTEAMSFAVTSKTIKKLIKKYEEQRK